MASRRLTVEIVGDAASLSRTLKGASRDIDKFGKQSGRSSKLLGTLGTAAKSGAAAGLLAAGAGAKVAYSEFREAEKVGRQTAQVLKSTGKAAGVTRKHIEGFAQALSKKTAIDDEAIQQGQNLLLTFTRIRNEAGKGNKIFDRTTRAAVDMSAAFEAAGKSMSIADASLQIGKALNDPATGMSRLTRVGVTFSEKQKEVVARLVETGKTAKAQKVILNELAKEFGGSAKATATPMKQLGVTLGNLAETVGAKFVPLLDKGAQAVNKFVGQMQSGKGAGGAFANAMKTAFAAVKAAVQTSITAVKSFLDRHRSDIKSVGQAAQNVGKVIKFAWENVVWPVFKRVLPAIRQIVEGTFKAIRGVIRVVTGILTGDFSKAWQGAKDIVGGTAKAMVGSIRAITAPFREAASKVAHAVKAVIGGAFTFLKDQILKPVLRFFLNVIDKWLWGIQKMVEVASKIPFIGDKFDGLKDDIENTREKLGNFKNSLDGLPDKKKKVDAVANSFGKVRDRISEAARAFGNLSGSFKDLKAPTVFNTPIGSGWPLGSQNASGVDSFTPIARHFGLTMTSGHRPGDDGYHGINRARDYSNSTGPTAQMMAFARYMVANYGSRLKELIYTPLGFSIKNGQRVPPYATADHYNHVHVAMRRGGMVPGSGMGDRVPAMLEPDEFVMNRRATGRFRPMLEAMNRGVPRMATGGLVAQAAKAAGFRGSALIRMVAEAKGESSWNERAVGDGGASKGLWQIHTGWNPWAASWNLFDPFVNARAAKRIYDSQGVGAWHADHTPHIAAARAAVASIQGKAVGGSGGSSVGLPAAGKFGAGGGKRAGIFGHPVGTLSPAMPTGLVPQSEMPGLQGVIGRAKETASELTTNLLDKFKADQIAKVTAGIEKLMNSFDPDWVRRFGKEAGVALDPLAADLERLNSGDYRKWPALQALKDQLEGIKATYQGVLTPLHKELNRIRESQRKEAMQEEDAQLQADIDAARKRLERAERSGSQRLIDEARAELAAAEDARGDVLLERRAQELEAEIARQEQERDSAITAKQAEIDAQLALVTRQVEDEIAIKQANIQKWGDAVVKSIEDGTHPLVKAEQIRLEKELGMLIDNLGKKANAYAKFFERVVRMARAAGFAAPSFSASDWKIATKDLGFQVDGAAGTGKVVTGKASGGMAWQSGMYRVGELGPETVRLPRGATVTPASVSGRGAPTVNVERMYVRRDSDIEVVSRKLGWQIAHA